MPNKQKAAVAMGDPSISTPFDDRNFDLLLVHRSAGGDNYFYLPASTERGLSLDLVRVDFMAGVGLPLQDIASHTLRAYAATHAPCTCTGRVVDVQGSDDLIFEYGFADHPLLGAHDILVRLARRGDATYAVHAIRKVVALSPEERKARHAFLCSIDPSAWQRPADIQLGEAALDAVRDAERLSQAVQDSGRADLIELPVDDIPRLLASASPLHDPMAWWLWALHIARTRLYEGRVDTFEATIRPLEIALFMLDDLKGSPLTDGKRFEAAGLLADMLMLVDYRVPAAGEAVEIVDATGSRGDAGEAATPLGEARETAGTYGEAREARAVHGNAHIAAMRRAAALNAAVAAHERGVGDAKRALGRAALAALASRLQSDVEPETIEPALPEALRPPRVEFQALRTVVAHLLSYSDRAAYCANHGRPALARHAGAAADMAQQIWSQADTMPRASHDEVIEHAGESLRIAQAQLGAQRLSYDLSEAEVERFVRLHPRIFGSTEYEKHDLLYLRPLWTTRRLLQRNRFAWWPRIEPKMRRALGTLSLEAILHLALVGRFRTFSYGGPPDLFGMKRGSFAHGGDTEGATWRANVAAAIRMCPVIVVTAGESQGLIWEIGEIRRQEGWSKMVLVMPPAGNNASALHAPQAASDSCRAAGLDVRAEDLGPGFLLLDAAGGVERHLPFDSLWDGDLCITLAHKAARRLRESRQ